MNMRKFVSRWRSILVAGALVAGAFVTTGGGVATALASPSQPNFGSSVYIFNPSMPQSQIQATVDAIASQQVSNQFGTQRYALLFEPGTYGSSANPLNFQVGYYTAVAGLGLSPNDVVINGSVYVRNQCFSGQCTALVNFWRSLSNLTINVTTPGFGCYSGEFWPVSQAAPMRRVHVNGLVTLMDYCTGPSFASGGFIADSAFDGSVVINGSQQQWVTRNSQVDSWTNGVWNQVFSGVVGAPAQCFPCGNQYTTLATSPVTREAPYLYEDSQKHFNVFVPAVQHNSAGTTWAGGQTPGASGADQELLHRRPDRLRGQNQRRAAPRQEPHPHPGRLSTGPDHRGHAPRHRGARARLPNPGPGARDRVDVSGEHEGGHALGDHLRRGPEELPDAAAGRERR